MLTSFQDMYSNAFHLQQQRAGSCACSCARSGSGDRLPSQQSRQRCIIRTMCWSQERNNNCAQKNKKNDKIENNNKASVEDLAQIVNRLCRHKPNERKHKIQSELIIQLR